MHLLNVIGEIRLVQHTEILESDLLLYMVYLKKNLELFMEHAMKLAHAFEMICFGENGTNLKS